MSNQLNEKESVINKKEQLIKNYRNKNSHLQNFKQVYDYRLSTLLEEKEPLTQHQGKLDENTKNIYKELLDEADANKTIMNEINDAKTSISQLKATG